MKKSGLRFSEGLCAGSPTFEMLSMNAPGLMTCCDALFLKPFRPGEPLCLKLGITNLGRLSRHCTSRVLISLRASILSILAVEVSFLMLFATIARTFASTASGLAPLLCELY